MDGRSSFESMTQRVNRDYFFLTRIFELRVGAFLSMFIPRKIELLQFFTVCIICIVKLYLTIYDLIVCFINFTTDILRF